MKNSNHTRRLQIVLPAVLMMLLLVALPESFQAGTTHATPPQANIGVNGFFAVDKARRGSTLQAAIVLDIPSGYHVNSNRPLAKFLIPTSLKVEAPRGMRIGPVSYPRAVTRSFSFSPDKLSVYEGRAILRFNLTVPASFTPGVTQLRVQVKYQSCNDEACFPPTTRTVSMPISVVDASESVKRINGKIFGGRG